MCRGFVRLMVALDSAGRVPRAAAPYNREEQRFWQRFSLFYDAAFPAPVFYDTYEQYVDPSQLQPQQLFHYALEVRCSILVRSILSCPYLLVFALLA